MIQALFLAFGQLFDRRIAGVFIKSLLVTLLLFAGVAVGLWWGMHWLTDAFASWLGGQEWARNIADISTIIIFLLSALFLFRVVAILVIGIFADEVVEAVEARHYPDAHAEARAVPLGKSIQMGIGSGVRAILTNLVLSPVYLLLLLTGIGTPIAFFLVNAWLLSRDLGDMVAVRHLPDRDLRRWRGRTRFRRMMLGMIATGLFFVPVLNLLAPILGAAMAAHLFHMGRRA